MRFYVAIACGYGLSGKDISYEWWHIV